MTLVTSIAISTAIHFALLCGIFSIVFAMELARPMGEQAPLRARFDGIRFMFIQVMAGAYILAVLQAVLFYYDYRPEPIFDARTVLGSVASAFVAIVLYDFFYYWVHRAQHTYPLLWRFHAVHHSVRHLSVPCGYGHFTEQIFKAIIILGPLSHLIAWNGAVVATLFILFQGTYIHSSTSISLGRGAWLIGDPRTHRIHHSREPEHFDRNFGSLTLVWDKLFGTAHFPRRDEWPDVGIDEHGPPTSVADYLFLPFRRHSEALGSENEKGTVEPQSIG
ncbi:MAG: hypothetical protein CL820_12025 [Croceicoccus sp.]|nr:hypothetical protein [Croceicoccus sp.]MAL26597.1 hypothetical protein [Croceicoccus sp.]